MPVNSQVFNPSHEFWMCHDRLQGPPIQYRITRDRFAPQYPLLDKVAELRTSTERYALQLRGAVCSCTTADYVAVVRASTGSAVPYPQLMQSLRQGVWHYTCRGIGSWCSYEAACAGILHHCAAQDEQRGAA